MTFGERLTELRKENGFNKRNDFAERLGIPSTTLRNYETNVREPGHTFLRQVSELFNVSVDYLLCLTDEKEVLNSFRLKSSEYDYIEKYRTLDNHGRETLNLILDRECMRVSQLNKSDNFSHKVEHGNIRHIQYYQRLASAGTGQIVFEDIPIDIIEIPDIREYRDVKYAIGVNGHSMEPLYKDGDTLLVEPTKEINENEIGIFIIDDESFVKRLGHNELISLNDEYDNIPFTQNIRCVGRVIDKLESKEQSYDFEKDYDTKLEEMTQKAKSHFGKNNDEIPNELRESFFEALEKKENKEA